MSRKQKIIIGRWDRVDLPELGLSDIQAKVDTGAYTSALHVTDLKKVVRDDQTLVEFRLIHPKASKDEIITLPFVAKRRIKSSTGVSRQRYVIKTKIVLFGRSVTAEFSLSDRSRMDFPILLGRKLLQGRFVVDVSKKDLSFRQKKIKSSTSDT